MAQYVKLIKLIDLVGDCDLTTKQDQQEWITAVTAAGLMDAFTITEFDVELDPNTLTKVNESVYDVTWRDSESYRFYNRNDQVVTNGTDYFIEYYADYWMIGD